MNCLLLFFFFPLFALLICVCSIIGRSNVGKSSLINSLLGKKQLARVSKTPGRTRLANLFSLSELLILMDLPGYGYAKGNKEELQKLGDVVYDCVLSREDKKVRSLLLVDARRGLMESDTRMIDALTTNHVPFDVVLTKIDQIKANELTVLSAELNRLFGGHLSVFPTSAKANIGIFEVKKHLGQICGVVKL